MKKEKTNMDIFESILKKLNSFFSGYVAIQQMRFATGGRGMYNGIQTYGDVAMEFTDDTFKPACIGALNELYEEIKKREPIEMHAIDEKDTISIYNLKCMRVIMELIKNLNAGEKLNLKKLVRLYMDLGGNIIDTLNFYPEVIDIVTACVSDDETVKLAEAKYNLNASGKNEYIRQLTMDAKGIPAYYVPSDISKMIDLLYLWMNRTISVNNLENTSDCIEIERDVIHAIIDRVDKKWVNLAEVPLADKMLYQKNHVMTFQMKEYTGDENDESWGSICKVMFPYITEKTMNKVKFMIEYQYHGLDTYAIYVKYTIPSYKVYCRYYEMPSLLPVSMDWENIDREIKG